VRNAVAYVLLNRQRHGGGQRVAFAEGNVDPCSSGAVFTGWVRGFKPDGPGDDALTVAPRSWLLSEGWRRRGLIDPREVPGPQLVR
jgi:hypothetical protein